MIGLPIAWAYGHVIEWGIHKYVLHGAGKKRDNFWSFHFFDHHRSARTKNMDDAIYRGSPLQWNPAGKELLGLGLLGAAHLPLAPVAPWFVFGLGLSGLSYYRKHKRSHLDLEWCRRELPWHYDHHMGPNQDANWGVRRDWVDRLMGTREPYMGTEKEARDYARRQARLAKEAAHRESLKNAQPERTSDKAA